MDIIHLSDNPQSTYIFWLSCMADTGKSTISHTVTQRWYDEEQLGAFFFFSRSQRDLANISKFFATLVCQLAYTQSSLTTPIRKAILNNPEITTLGLHDQWEHLIC